MKIVTWNLRCQWKEVDGVNAFIHRAGFIYEKTMQELPDVIAFQEVVPQSLELLKRMLVEYEFVGGMRSKTYGGEGLYTAFRKDRFAILSSDFFWLSPTPYIAGSCYENENECPRVCSYVKLRNKTDHQVLNVFNLHLDHLSEKANELGLKYVFDYIDARKESIDKDKTVILGDFNALSQSETIKTALAVEWLCESTKDIDVTFHGFGTENYRKIDYILISKALEGRIEKVGTWTDEHSSIYLSDHYPVCLELTE